MSQGLDLAISAAVVEQQPYRLEGLVIAVLPIDDDGSTAGFRLVLQVEASGPWAVLAEMAADDPEALEEWCAIAVRALDRAVMEGMNVLILPLPIRCSERVVEPEPELESGPKPSLWQRLRRSFARRSAPAP